ncbi:hypothetical protein EJB05_15014, partial [Eragrostis curvula]
MQHSQIPNDLLEQANIAAQTALEEVAADRTFSSVGAIVSYMCYSGMGVFPEHFTAKIRIISGSPKPPACSVGK